MGKPHEYPAWCIVYTDSTVQVKVKDCPIGHTCVVPMADTTTCAYFLGAKTVHHNALMAHCSCPQEWVLDPRLVFYEEIMIPWQWPPKVTMSFGEHGLVTSSSWQHRGIGPFILYVCHPIGTYAVAAQDPDAFSLIAALTDQGGLHEVISSHVDTEADL